MSDEVRVECGRARVQGPLPLCQECKSIYDMYKIFNDGLRDTPDD